MNGTDIDQMLDIDRLLIENSLSSLQILLSLSITLIMALLIFYIYRKTYSGVLYSKNFNLTLVMVAIAINAIVIGISGNLMLSLGMIGALSIVRFRTAVKDPRDTAFIFWAITIGIVNGVEYYQLSIIVSVFIAAVLLVFSRSFSIEPAYMLILKYDTSETYTRILSVLQDKTSISHFCVRSDMIKGDQIEKVTEVKIKPGKSEALLQQLRAIPGLQTCTLLSSSGEFTE